MIVEVSGISIKIIEENGKILLPFSEIKKLSNLNENADHVRIQRQLEKEGAEKYTFDRSVFYECKSLLTNPEVSKATYNVFSQYWNDKLKKAVEQLPTLRTELSNIKADNQSKSTLIATQRNEISELQKVTNLKELAEKEGIRLKKELEILKNDKQNIVSQLNKSNSEKTSYTNLQATYNELQLSYSELQASYKALEKNGNNWQQDNRKTIDELAALKASYTTLEATYNDLQTTYNEVETELRPHINKMKNGKKLIRSFLYLVLVIAAATTGRVFFVEAYRLDGQTKDIVFLMSILFGSMMGITTFFTGHLEVWKRRLLLGFFCTVEFASMSMYLKVFEQEVIAAETVFQWTLKFTISFFLPITNLILANIIEHIRSEKSNY